MNHGATGAFMGHLRARAAIRTVWCCLLVLVAAWIAPVHAWPLLVTDATATVSVPAPLPTLREDTPLAAETALQQAFTTAPYAASIQPSPHYYWYRLDIQAQLGDSGPRRFYLSTDTHILRHLDFYIFRGDTLIQQQRNGLLDSAPVADYTGIYLTLDLQANDQVTVLIRKQNDGPGILPLRLLSETAFAAEQQRLFMVWGAIVAVLLVLALYNALIYAMHPGPAYFWYLCFHSITFCYFSGIHGYGFWLWPDEVQRWLAQNVMPMNFLLLWLVLQFANTFLDARRHAPWHHRLLPWFSALCLPGAAIALWLPEYQVIPAFSVLQIVGTLFCLSMGVTALRNGFRPAVFFLLSWIFTGAGAGIGMATFIGLVPAHFLTMHAFVVGSVAELITLSVALADRIKFMENKALAQAFIDPQTNAPNFSFFKNKFPEQLNELQQRHPHLFLLVLDLHGFRELVGLLGPDVLKQAYDRHVERTVHLLQQRPWAVPVRTLQGKDAFFMSLPGGQEMLLVSTRDPVERSVEPMIRELLKLADEAITVNDINSKIGFRIGCAAFRPQQHSIFECFRQAQIALLTAHRNKRPYEIFAGDQDIFIKHRLSLLSDLRLAIAEEALTIYIQPQIRLRDGALVGGEVLVRWQHPTEGFVSPSVFIPLAEQSQLIFDITRQVLQKTCSWLQQHTLPDDFHLSVNLSALDISDSRLLSLIRHCVHAYNVPPHRLLFEVTESAVLDDPERFLDVIQALHDMGFKIAIDDFGTGYSSMSYLQQMNADEIKIDIRFVRDIHASETNQNIVKAIVQLARATGAYTVAEGIETEAELAVLRALNCELAQGYLWSPALPAPVFVESYLQQEDKKVGLG